MNETDRRQPTPDPLIDEVRAIRKDISDRFDNDVDKLCEYLRELEKQHPERLIDPTKNHLP